MPRWRTHERFAKSILPNIDPKVLRNVNRALDRPNRSQMALSKALGTNKYSMPGLNMYPHRKHTHSLIDSTMIGFMNGGMDGVFAAYAHDLLDSMRDRVVSKAGGYQADIWEAYYNYFMSQNKNKRM